MTGCWQAVAPSEPGWYVCAFADDPGQLDIAKVGDDGYEEGTQHWAMPVAKWSCLWWDQPVPEPG